MEREKKSEELKEEVKSETNPEEVKSEDKQETNPEKEKVEEKEKVVEKPTREKKTPPEEVKEVVVDVNAGKVFYKKVGGGSARLANRIIKPGEKVWLFPDQIPLGMRDLFVPLTNIPLKKEDAIVVDITKADYKLKRRGENSPWWDIVDSNGKPLNDKALTKAKAEEFIQDLMK